MTLEQYTHLAEDAKAYAGEDQYGGAQLLREVATALEDLIGRVKMASTVAYSIQSMPSAYTRMPGPQGNGERVANLLSDDATKYGTALRRILAGEESEAYKAMQSALEYTKGAEAAETESLKIKGFEVRFVEAVYNADTSGIDVYQENEDALQLVKAWDLATQHTKWPGRNDDGLLIATVGETYQNWGVTRLHFQPLALPGSLRFRVVRKAH